MIDPENVPEVGDDETLARYVLHSNHIRRTSQTVKPDAFIPHPHGELSVTRHLLMTEDELWAVGRAVAAATIKTLHGRADIRMAVCLAQQLTVRAAPMNDNPNHADITGWPADKPAQKIIAQEIAATAQFMANG
jgi:hypothetical protein